MALRPDGHEPARLHEARSLDVRSWLWAAALWLLSVNVAWAEPCAVASIVPKQEQREEVMREARAHVTRGDYAEARALYLWLLAREPSDREVRVALARVHAWDHCFVRAATLYETLLREQPNDVEALSGFIDVLAWTGRYREAQAATARGLALFPDSAELWLRRARFSFWSGEKARAIEEADHAERLAPNDQSVRTFRDGLFQTQLRTSALVSRFPDGYPGLYVGSLQAQHFMGRLELGAEAQLVARAGGSLERRLLDGLYSASLFYHSRPRVALGMGVSFGAPDHSVPRYQLRPSLFYQVSPRWSAALGYAYWGYRTDKVAHILTPSLGFQLTERLLLDLRSLTSYVVLEAQEEGVQKKNQRVVTGAGARLSWRFRPSIGVAGGYTYGPQLEQVSGYQFLGMVSHVFNLSADWRARRHVGVQPSFTFERRSSDNGVVVLIYSTELASYVRW